MDSSATSLRDTQIWRSWQYMTPLEKFLLILSVVFSIVIYCLMLVLIARDYRNGGPAPIDKIKNCSFSTHDWQKNAPLILSADRATTFVYPDTRDGTIKLSSGSSVLLACPGTKILGLQTNDSQLELSCSNGQCLALRQNVSPKQLTCTETFNSTARYTGNACFGDAKEVEIGYQLNATTFVSQIKLCFDAANKITLYSEFTLPRSIGGRPPNNSKPSFDAGVFYEGLDPNKLYTGQAKTINTLLGLEANSSYYINHSNGSFLSRGHLSARADFPYPSQQNATFYYVNAAPQWQAFNGGNWKRAEEDTRRLANRIGADLLVYTGTYGVARLANATGNLTDLYLAPGALPVPRFFWKVVYSPDDKQGVALVGVNNPYVSNATMDEYVICTDVTSRVGWLSWAGHNVTLGLAYACEIDDLRKNITYIPSLDVRGLLT